MNSSLYTRPKKPKKMIVTNRRGAPIPEPLELTNPLIVDAFTECHVTPEEESARMVQYLEAYPGCRTLEPEAGTGSLIAALLADGHPAIDLVAIERHVGLCNHIDSRFNALSAGAESTPAMFTLRNECFLDYSARVVGKESYSRIIMNPPFRKVRAHLKAALDLLSKDGHDEAILVALVPITYQHPEAEEMEVLNNDTFPLVKVNTKIIRITKCR